LARRRQEQKGISRFDHVSTAFVAGRRTDVVLEAELEAPLGHKNSYEASKFEGEKLVRSHMPELPIAIFRPSIVVGAAADGSTTSFNVIYWPIRVYSKGLWRICPGHPQTPIDLVPVDFVSDAITSLRELPESIGKCFHLAAGADGAERLGDLTELVRRFFAVKHPVVFVNPGPWMRWVHPVLKHLTFGPPRRVVRSGEVYVPYFCGNPLFDTTNTRELLASTEVSVPRVSDYLERLFKYCVDTDWGRAPLEPREIAGQTPAQ
jgi:nucleoside-diphosphate-sugar epimerase